MPPSDVTATLALSLMVTALDLTLYPRFGNRLPLDMLTRFIFWFALVNIGMWMLTSKSSGEEKEASAPTSQPITYPVTKDAD